ncbi:uncharacterized protein [Panulirus ornatus]|uniref:uncharacterized protein isoform X3 n=2 Tax=Panulirus ornatus TaxID=150431 RepID=UPI003A8C4BCA
MRKSDSMAVNKKPIGVNFEKLLQSLQGNVHEMKLEFDESRLPINDDNKHLHQFCDRVEFVLKFGLKERGSVLGGRKDLWQYFCKCLAERRNIHDGLKLVKANTELKTSVGRSRCFLRYCLVHQCMGDVIQQCLDNHAVTRQFYQDGALMLDQKLCPALLNILYQLCDVSFDLPPTGHDLDVSWPTYARHGGGVWRPPTRTVSLSSLCSYTSQLSEAVTSQLGNTPSMASVSEDNQSPDCNHSPSHGIAHANMEASQDMTTIQERLALLEEDNASLRASCASLQHKLDQAQQYSTVDTSSTTVDPDNSDTSITYNKCCQCEQLSEELRISKDKCTELQHLHQLLEKEVKTLLAQVDNFQTQENDLKSELKKLEQKLQDTVSAGERLSTGVHELLKETDPPAVPRMDMATITHEQSAISKPTNAILLPDIEHSLDPQEVLNQYRHKLENLEKENKALQEQCHAAEMEKNTLRTNIRKVSANWFERKTRLSDSDTDSHHGEDVCAHQDSSSSHTEVGIQVPDFVPENHHPLKRRENIPKLLAEISFTTGKLELTERMCAELKKRVKDYENVIDDQEIIIHGLKDQLDTYFNDNQKMSQQLSTLTKLFEDLELTEKTRVNEVNPPDNCNISFSSLPSEEDFKKMSNSVSKTYIKLKELIFEKKSLVTEIERLKVLNIELQRRVAQQETRLVNVSDALHTTWMLVSDMKEQHARLHSSESVLRYELKEKRELLHHLRDELECSREQWHKIRQMNMESEEAWNNLREELNERRRIAEKAVTSNGGECLQEEKIEGATVASCTCAEFEPPVDLLLDMAIEYGVIDADDDTSTSMVAAIEGEDMHATRLQDLEDQCSYLYQKLMASTARSLTLASRLTALHQHYGSSDDDDDDDNDDDEEDDYFGQEDDEENYQLHNIDTEILSPDPESSDTAYLSEADTGSATSGAPGNLSEEEGTTAGGNEDESFSPAEDTAEVDDDLSKRLINFLPRKIEMLHKDNKKLEERCNQLLEEKTRSEAQLMETLEGERRLNKQMEEKLEHLGKCVDELKLERNGKISEAEEKLKQKVASLSQQEKKYESLEEEVDILKDRYEERGRLLHIATDRVKELETSLHASEATAKDTLTQLNQANVEVTRMQTIHSDMNCKYEQLKTEVHTLQQQVADLRFQVSSKDMEHAAAVKADLEKSEALTAAASQISEQEAKITQLEEDALSQKQLLLTEQDRLTSQVNELTQNLLERDNQCSCLNDRLQQAEATLKVTQQNLSKLQAQLHTTKEASFQLSDDNGHLREKIIQLLSRRVRVCDDCFSVQAELATLVSSPSSYTNSGLDGSLLEGKLSTIQTPSTTHPLPTDSQQTDCDEYAVISDDEVQSSRLSSSPSSGSPPSNSDVITETRATEDILTIDTLSTSPPTNAENVSFAVLHQPHVESPERSVGDDNPAACEQRILIPTTRVASTQGAAVRGRLDTKQSGIYTLVFDNSTSRFTARKVTYSMSLKKPVSSEAVSPPLTSSQTPTSLPASLPVS